MANTLNPYYEGNDLSEMIADDRLILDTLDQWYFGPDDTGDIMNKENIKGLQERTGQMGPVHLVSLQLLYELILCDNLHFTLVFKVFTCAKGKGKHRFYTMVQICKILNRNTISHVK